MKESLRWLGLDFFKDSDGSDADSDLVGDRGRTGRSW